MTEQAVLLGVRVVVFAGVFALAAHRHPRIAVKPKLALPLVGLIFALLNTGLYWLLKPVLGLATFGAATLIAPLVVNGLLLWATAKVLRPLRIDGFVTAVYLALLLTVAHGLINAGFHIFAS